MIGVEPLEQLIKYCLISGRIKDEKPLSMILIANAEAGKTTLIRKYCLKSDSVFYTTDATAYGIIRDSNELRDFEQGKYTHIIIPDLLSCLARKESTVNTFIHFMNSIIEEGIVSISTYASKVSNISKDKKIEINVGLITSITRDIFMDKRHRWNKIGFLSRVLPVSYDYTIATRLKIFNFIEKEEHLSESIERLKYPFKVKKEVILPEELAKRVEPYAIAISEAQKLYGFRFQRQFQTLLKAIALSKGRQEVIEEDLNEFENLSRYININFTQI